MQIVGCSIQEGNLVFLDWLDSSIPRRSVYFAWARYDGKGEVEGVTRAIRETIGNCTIVHREMIVGFEGILPARSNRSRFSDVRSNVAVSLHHVGYHHVKKLHTSVFSFLPSVEPSY